MHEGAYRYQYKTETSLQYKDASTDRVRSTRDHYNGSVCDLLNVSTEKDREGDKIATPELRLDEHHSLGLRMQR